MSMSTALQKKHGPLKTWQWGALIAGAVALGLILRARSQANAASGQTVDPNTSSLPIDPWTGLPYSMDGLGGGGAPGVSGSVPDPLEAAVPVTMDPPDWYTNPPYWWNAPAAVPNQDSGVATSAGNDGPAAGTNSAPVAHKAISPPKATPASIKAAPPGAKSGTPQKTTSGGGPVHVNPANHETFTTIVKDHKVYHYYAGRTGPTKYVYVRPASKGK